MKIALVLFLVFAGSFLFASEGDTSSYDTNYRLYDVQPTVDTNVQLRFEEPEWLRDDPSDEWITGPLSGGPHPIGGNYDSIHNFNPKLAALISVSFLLFVFYVIWRVRRSLKKDERRRNDRLN